MLSNAPQFSSDHLFFVCSFPEAYRVPDHLVTIVKLTREGDLHEAVGELNQHVMVHVSVAASFTKKNCHSGLP